MGYGTLYCPRAAYKIADAGGLKIVKCALSNDGAAACMSRPFGGFSYPRDL